MKLNFKQPKYVLPIIFIPFICLFFYIYESKAKKVEVEVVQVGLQENLADVSGDVKESSVTNKLDAFRNQFKETDRLTAIENIEYDQEVNNGNTIGSLRDEDYRKQLERNATGGQSSIPELDSYTANPRRTNQEDEALANALNVLANGTKATTKKEGERLPSYREQNTPSNQYDVNEPDPMELFKQQMVFVDSMSKASDPEYQAELEREKLIEKAELELSNKPLLNVEKAGKTAKVFNTIRSNSENSFIKAIVDENVQGHAGSRIRLRLLEDVNVGSHFVKRGTYIYAEITNFTDQRVGLTIKSIIKENKIFPVKLVVYDLDGMAGLYVPASQFREFSKELGGSSLQGVNMQSSSQNKNEFIMSAFEKMFTSTSTAIANVIRKNKAKLKYNTFIYIIDPKELDEQQKSY